MATKQKLISKTEFARIVGIDKGLVSRMSKSKLAGAMVGNRIDVAHPIVESYVMSHQERQLKSAQEEGGASKRAIIESEPIQKRGKKDEDLRTNGNTFSRERLAYFFGFMDDYILRTLQDSPRIIAESVISAWNMGETTEEIEVIIRDLLDTQIERLEKEVLKAIRSA